MSKKRKIERKIFSDTTDALVREVVLGKWNHVSPDWSSIPVEDWSEVIQKYSLRCPGYDKEDYTKALRRSQWNYR